MREVGINISFLRQFRNARQEVVAQVKFALNNGTKGDVVAGKADL